MDEENDPDLAALVEPLYEAVTEPEMWQVFLEKASEALHADKAAILIYSTPDARASVCADLGFSDELRRVIEETTQYNPWVAEIRKHRSEGWYSGSIDDAVPMDVFRKSDFYQECVKHQVEWTGAAVIFAPGDCVPVFAVARPETQPPFGARDKELLRELVPHLRTAFKTYQALISIRESAAAGRFALDVIGAACMMLDGDGQVLAMNKRAEVLTANGETLRIKERKPLAALSQEQGLLDACIASACSCGAGNSTYPGVGGAALHSWNGSSLYISVLPYRASRPFIEQRPVALLFITTHEEQGRGEHRLWQSIFGLSPAECRVAEMMMHGMEVAEISEAIRIKVDTVRYYQKCVYRKTGVRGQGQLMRLLARLPFSTSTP